MFGRRRVETEVHMVTQQMVAVDTDVRCPQEIQAVGTIGLFQRATAAGVIGQPTGPWTLVADINVQLVVTAAGARDQ